MLALSTPVSVTSQNQDSLRGGPVQGLVEALSANCDRAGATEIRLGDLCDPTGGSKNEFRADRLQNVEERPNVFESTTSHDDSSTQSCHVRHANLHWVQAPRSHQVCNVGLDMRGLSSEGAKPDERTDPSEWTVAAGCDPFFQTTHRPRVLENAALMAERYHSRDWTPCQRLEV